MGTVLLGYKNPKPLPVPEHTRDHIVTVLPVPVSRLIDMMFSHLSERAEANMIADKMVMIETLRFMDEIERANSPTYWNMESKSFMRRLEKWVENNEIVAMVFPVFMAAQSIG